MTRVVHKYICLVRYQSDDKTTFRITTHSFEVPVYHFARMEVVESVSDVGQLVVGVSEGQTQRERHLRAQIGRHRSVFLMYSDRSPPGIQSEMSWRRGEVWAPRRGTMFGWFKRFHVTASLQKACDFHERMGKVKTSITYLDDLFWRIITVYLHPFDTNL
jgi:hypothetical protein